MESTIKFTYQIDQIDTFKQSTSPRYYFSNLPWQISAKKNETENGTTTLALCLECIEESTSWACYAVIDLTLLNNKHNTPAVTSTIKKLFYTRHSRWGYSDFISWKDLLDHKNGYLYHNSITLQVSISKCQGGVWDISVVQEPIQLTETPEEKEEIKTKEKKEVQPQDCDDNTKNIVGNLPADLSKRIDSLQRLLNQAEEEIKRERALKRRAIKKYNSLKLSTSEIEDVKKTRVD